MKYVCTCLPTQKTEEMHTTHLQLMQLLHAASLFATLIAVDGTSRDSGPSGHGKTTCGNSKDALQYFNKFSWVMASTHNRTPQLS